MIHKYNFLWPDHPFQFRIPYQQLAGENDARHDYIEAPKDIRGTVTALLQDLPDDEWIYWCIDDKYPVWLDVPAIRQLMNDMILPTVKSDGLLFCRCRSMLDGVGLRRERLKAVSGQVYLRRKNYEQIWIHQFVRVKVIRHLFEQFADDIPNAKVMDDMKKKVLLPESHALYVTRASYAVFGESTTRGKLTMNCYHSIVEAGDALPDMPVDKESIFMGGDEVLSLRDNIKLNLKRVKNYLVQ
ncbi:hypothetical protein [Catalinimonas alkaloidigena]|nr:hypothetical protein [Catalinimonas alkaloidigena]